ncbi:prenyltransferase [Thalassobacillus devorans]|uniref:prenyltransferase n=1 Tax=Thalassobacillus devorans TaxID=279813 RepID=UPI0004B678C7|nr:prenyltransferase [Thalassobacillus devorans]
MRAYKTAPQLEKDIPYTCKLSWLQLMRPLTWSGTISPILAGSLLAGSENALHYEKTGLLVIAALLIQSGANLFNDYFDFRHGQDNERWHKVQGSSTNRYPCHHQVPAAGAILMAAAVLLGGRLAFLTGWWVAVVGILGILAGISYSAGRRSLASRGLGEWTAGLFLGMVTTLLGYSVQTGTITVEAVLTGIVFALLISSMVLTNNIRDIKKDEGFRRTIAMKLGHRNAIRLLKGLLFSAYLLVIILVTFSFVPVGVLVVLLAFPLAIRIPRSFGAQQEEAQLAMKRAALHHWAFGMLFILGMVIGSPQVLQ